MTNQAGWYPDQTDSARERFFDGAAWTDQTRQRPAPSEPSLPTPPPLGTAKPSSDPAVPATAVLTLLFFPAGLVAALVGGQKAAAAGRRQQPIWVAFAVCCVINLCVGFGLYALTHRGFDATGTFTLNDSTTAFTGCRGEGGYSDIGPQTQLTISADGKIVGFTNLGQGQPDTSGGTCTWNWSISGLPGGHTIYSVEVGRRGPISYTKEQLEAGSAAITLG